MITIHVIFSGTQSGNLSLQFLGYPGEKGEIFSLPEIFITRSVFFFLFFFVLL